MHPVCNGCPAPCCVGRVVPLGDDEVARLSGVVGVAPQAFSERGDAGARLRQRDDGACVFAIEIAGSIRCGIEGEKPRACRVYPYHIEVREDGAWAAALGGDAACPLPRDQAWATRVDEERTTIETAILESNGIAVRKLPVVSDSACFGCSTSCCLDYAVPVNAHDVWRLARALGVPWRALVTVQPTPGDWMESFALDGSERKFALHLHRRTGGACALLTTLPDGSQRCGVHAIRPLACRLYPYRGDWQPGEPVRLQADAICPPPQRARYRAQRLEAVPEVVVEVGERQLYMRAIARWELAARTRPIGQPYAVDDYLRWAFSLYDAIEVVRRRGPTGFDRAASEVIATFPLPDEGAPGC
jgi:Fe-S-cluster containining protein